MANLNSTQIYGDLTVNGEIKNKATTTSEGVVKLNNTINSTSTTEAATANAVKLAYDKANHSHPYASTSLATATSNGLMSSTDKIALDNLAAYSYTHPTTSGYKHIPSGGAKDQILRWSSDGTAVWSNEVNTTYSIATTASNGLMSSTDKSKLDNISVDANKTVLNNTVTSTSTTEAATANAVKTAYDKANHSHPYASSGHTHNYAGSASAGGPATTALTCTGNSATATKLLKAISLSLSNAIVGSASIDGSSNITLSTSLNSILIPAGANLNTYLTPGLYYSNTGDDEILNAPPDSADTGFSLFVNKCNSRTIQVAYDQNCSEWWYREISTTASNWRKILIDGSDIKAAYITGLLNIINIPTGTTSTTVALGNHTHINYASTDVATSYANGLMSSADKRILNSATPNELSETLVYRDADGNFCANEITAYLNGEASQAFSLATARKITLKGSVTGYVTFDGTQDVSITTSTNHTHSYAAGEQTDYGTVLGNLGNNHAYRGICSGSSSFNINDLYDGLGSTTTYDDLVNVWENNDNFNLTYGVNAISFGADNIAYGYGSACIGYYNRTKGPCSQAIGYSCQALNEGSIAMGYETIASGYAAYAEGYDTTASGSSSHAEGYFSKASGDYSHASGMWTTASGYISHSEGLRSVASGSYSNTAGMWTTAETFGAYVIGKYNKVNSGSATIYSAANNAFVIGNGSSSTTKSNSFRVTFNGAAYGLSAFNSTGADYAEYFEWSDGNLNNEDRIGKFVTLYENKIRLANEDDNYILGVVSGNPAVIGNVSDDSWNDMYLRDEYGRLQYEDVEVKDEETEEFKIEKHIKLNPEYNPELEYISRSERQEWDTIGMLGQLIVNDDGTCKVNEYCKPSNNGIATYSNNPSDYRVIQRINEHLIKVIFK